MSQTVAPTLEPPRWARSLQNLPIPVAVVAIVLALAHVPILYWHMHFLNLRPHYELYPLVFLGSAVLAIPAIRLIAAGHRPGPGEARIGLILLAINLGMLTVAVVLNSPWLGMVSFIELLVAGAVLAGGWQVLRAAIPAIVFLFLIVPPPFALDSKLVTSLQTVTSKVGSRVLDRLNVIHYPDGNTVEIGSKQYFVDTACSGINSLFSTITVTLFCILFFGVFSKATWGRALLRTVLLFGAVIFWVVMANVARVTLIVWLDNRFGIDLGPDKDKWDLSNGCFYQHTILGFVLFGIVLAMMYSTNQFLMFLGTAVRWGDAPTVAPDDPAPVRYNTPRSFVGWTSVAPALAVYGLLLVFQVGEIVLGEGQVSESQLVQVYNTWTENDLPEQIGPWQRMKEFKFQSRDRDNPFGAHSRTWRYQMPNGLAAVVSFDYPFPEWHDLRICYRGVGWVVAKADVFNAPSPTGGAELECMKFELDKPFAHRGYGWFTEFDQSGNPARIHEVDMTRQYLDVRWSDRFTAIRDRWSSLLHKAPAGPRSYDVLQVQTFLENFGPLEDYRKQDLRPQVEQLFVQAAELIRAKCAAAVAMQAAH